MQTRGTFRNHIRLFVVGPILNILVDQFSHSNIDYTHTHSHPSPTHTTHFTTLAQVLSLETKNWVPEAKI